MSFAAFSQYEAFTMVQNKDQFVLKLVMPVRDGATAPPHIRIAVLVLPQVQGHSGRPDHPNP